MLMKPKALIAFRVWRSQQSVKLHPEKLNLLPTMVLIIESGAIYSFALTSMLVVYVLDNNGECVIMDMVSYLRNVMVCIY